jgi:hypothetical protein
VSGGGVLGPEHLADGIHPSDEGHRILARVFGGRVAAQVPGAVRAVPGTSGQPEQPAAQTGRRGQLGELGGVR